MFKTLTKKLEDAHMKIQPYCCAPPMSRHVYYLTNSPLYPHNFEKIYPPRYLSSWTA
jgi:hypothetical protein